MKFRDFDKYDVLEDGRIWSYSHKKFLKPCTMKDGKLVMTFQSTQEANRQGYNRSAVSYCCIGKLQHYKGYTWKYI